MTPEEKAKELYDKFSNAIVLFSKEGGLHRRRAKQCAIICVQEIIAETEGFIPEWENLYFKQRREFYQQVLEHLQKQS